MFCEGCMQTWWGFQSMGEDGDEQADPYIGSESDRALDHEPIDDDD